jgi:hypothetical protein
MKARLAAADAASYVEARRGDRRTSASCWRWCAKPGAEALKHLGSGDLAEDAQRRGGPGRPRQRFGVVAGERRASDAVAGGVHAGNLVKLAAPLVGGKGGGQAAQAQGGGKDPASRGVDAALAAIRGALAG